MSAGRSDGPKAQKRLLGWGRQMLRGPGRGGVETEGGGRVGSAAGRQGAQRVRGEVPGWRWRAVPGVLCLACCAVQAARPAGGPDPGPSKWPSAPHPCSAHRGGPAGAAVPEPRESGAAGAALRPPLSPPRADGGERVEGPARTAAQDTQGAWPGAAGGSCRHRSGFLEK